ncbi:hypothetical protein EON67_00125, partial [archaeon]
MQVLPLVGGLLVDRVGARSISVCSSVLALAGHLLVVLGLWQHVRTVCHVRAHAARSCSMRERVHQPRGCVCMRACACVCMCARPRARAAMQSWGVMWTGRAVFGIGTETLCVTQRALIAQWFTGSELALAMGILLAVGRLSSVFNDQVCALFSSNAIVLTYLTGAGICALSAVAAAASIALDVYVYGRGRAPPPLSPVRRAGDSVTQKGGAPTSVASSVWLELRRSLRMIRQLPARFWVISLAVVGGYVPVSTFNGVAA